MATMMMMTRAKTTKDQDQDQDQDGEVKSTQVYTATIHKKKAARAESSLLY
jgi:hypothetical protein